MEEHPKFTVFEISNASARELYIGLTPLVFSDFLAGMRDAPPEPVAHWDAGDDVTYRGLEFALPLEAAREYFRRHLGTLDRAGWRLIVDRRAELGRERRRPGPAYHKARREAPVSVS